MTSATLEPTSAARSRAIARRGTPTSIEATASQGATIQPRRVQCRRKRPSAAHPLLGCREVAVGESEERHDSGVGAGREAWFAR